MSRCAPPILSRGLRYAEISGPDSDGWFALESDLFNEHITILNR